MGLTFRTEMEIGAPPERVFEAMTDPECWHHWMENLVRVDVLTDGPLGPGSQWRETRRMFGKDASELFEVKGFEAGRRLSLEVDGSQGSTGRGLFRFDYCIEPLDEGSRLRMNGRIEMPGFLSRLMSRLMMGTFKKACDKDLSALKKWLENGSVPG